MTENKELILIIDDDMALQAMLDMALRTAGFEVLAAFDGQEGLAKVEAIRPNLVLADIMMPNMDGVELFQLIKERLQDDGIPIIIMTGLSRKPWFADLEADGAAIIQKPFEIGQLVDLVHILLT